MHDIITTIENTLDTLRGKQIEISYNESVIKGVLQSFKSRQYFYELIVKSGRYKKKIVFFYPFSVKAERGKLLFDYRIKKLPACILKELVYNMDEIDFHPFYNTIVKVCELT